MRLFDRLNSLVDELAGKIGPPAPSLAFAGNTGSIEPKSSRTRFQKQAQGTRIIPELLHMVGKGDPQLPALRNSTELRSAKKTASLCILPGINSYDVDWEWFGNNVLRWHVAERYDFSDFLKEDGNYDYEAIDQYLTGKGWNYQIGTIRKALKDEGLIRDDGSRNPAKIIEAAKNKNITLALIALGDPEKTLSPEQMQEMAQGSLELALYWFNEKGNLQNFFEVIDRFFTLFIDSFEVLNEQLPEVCNHEHLKLLSKINLHEGESHHYSIFTSKGIKAELARKMAKFIADKTDLVYALLELRDLKKLKLKSTGKAHAIGEIVKRHQVFFEDTKKLPAPDNQKKLEGPSK